MGNSHTVAFGKDSGLNLETPEIIVKNLGELVLTPPSNSENFINNDNNNNLIIIFLLFLIFIFLYLWSINIKKMI